MSAPVHAVFTVTLVIEDGLVIGAEVACTCGHVSDEVYLELAVGRYGLHCYQAAIDRAVEILES